MIDNLASASALVFDPSVLLVLVLSGVLGLVIGALPGLTATLGAALLIPFVFFLDPVPAIGSIITMAAMAIFAGDIPGALLRMPGTPSSAAYVEDAYRLTRNGRGAIALGVSLCASVIGGLGGSIFLILVAPIVGEFALNFTSYEYFWVAVIGLTAAVIVSQGSQVKGAIALCVGLLISTVGMDVSMGHPRFTFGLDVLYRGVDFIPAMIGLFGVSEVMRNVTRRRQQIAPVPDIDGRGAVRGTMSELWRYRRRLVEGNLIGSGVGVLPGAGADIAAWIAYAVTKNSSKDGRRFGQGKGHVEPIVSAGAANNSALASAFVPTLGFGIPGDTITAILLGVLLVKGVEPGPNLFTAQADTLYSIYILFILANLLLLPLGFLAVRASGAILRIPRSLLMALIISLSITGAYAINNGHMEVLIVAVFGVLGFLFERWRIPLAPVVLGIVLGPIVERTFMQSVIKTEWDLTQFFSRPISAVLVVIAISVLALPAISALFRRVFRGRRAEVDEDSEPSPDKVTERH